MDLGVFYEVVIPLLEMGNAVLIMISTPVDGFNFFSGLLNLKDPETGERVFLVYEAEMICARCKERLFPARCRHMLKYLPPWKSAEKMDLVSLILKDRQTILQRESMGVITDNNSSLIEKEYIDAFLKKPFWEPPPFDYPRQILIICDPNSSKTASSSEMALMAIIHERNSGGRVVCIMIGKFFFYFYLSISIFLYFYISFYFLHSFYC